MRDRQSANASPQMLTVSNQAPDDFGRYAGREDAIRNVLGHDTPGSNQTASSYGNTGDATGPDTDEGILIHFHLSS